MSRVPFSRLRGGGRGWLLLSLASGWFLTLGTRFVVPAVLPGISAEFALSNTAAGVAVTVIWLAYGATQLPAGVLVDRLGERRLLVGSVLVGGGGLLAIALSPFFLVLLVAGAAYGVGSGLFGPSRATVLTRTFPEHDGSAFSVVLAAGSIGAASLPLVGGVLAGWFDWRLALGTFVPLYLLVAVGLWRAVPPGVTGAPSGRPVRERVAGVSAAVRQRAVILPGLGILFMLFAFQGLSSFLPTYLVTERGFSQPLAATVFASMFVAGALLQVLTGGLADRYGYRPILLGATVLSVPPLLLLPVATGLVAVTGVTLLFGLRFIVAPLTNSYIVRVLPEAVRGTAWGFVRSVFFAVGATGSTVVGALADSGLFDEAFVLLAGVTVLAAVCYAMLPPRESAARSVEGPTADA